MTPRILKAVITAAALGLAACGGSSPSSRTVGASGATLTAGPATLTIPAGALTSDTSVTVSQGTPKNGGDVRIEMEPAGKALAKPALLCVEDGTTNVKSVTMVDDAGTAHDTEIEDRNHSKYKTSVTTLGAIEMKVEHGAACATACAAGEECDDGVCKPHTEDSSKKACDKVCDSGQECDDGVCKTHSEFETEHGGTGGTCTPACAAPLHCDTSDLVCKS